ncbi:MAG: hypothetical protein KBD16_00730 [Candidatus Pacebacteria bacterium]|nr:hypothetical protein [Candidatus Paceibacterota bacterium]
MEKKKTAKGWMFYGVEEGELLTVEVGGVFENRSEAIYARKCSPVFYEKTRIVPVVITYTPKK